MSGFVPLFWNQLKLLRYAEMVDMTHACFSDPNKMSCMDASGFYPESAVMMDMSSLCESLPWLTGCSVKRLCDTERATGKYCTPWSIAASLCNKDDHHGSSPNPVKCRKRHTVSALSLIR
jgi:hypothetical protein